MEAGGSGVIFGRNVWQREWNEALAIVEQIKEIAARQRAAHPLSDGGSAAAAPSPLSGAWSGSADSAAVASAARCCSLAAAVLLLRPWEGGRSSGSRQRLCWPSHGTVVARGRRRHARSAARGGELETCG